MLFQFDIYDIMNILRLIMILLQVVGSIGLVIAGVSKFRNNGTINNSIMFTIGGVIVIIYFVINERISSLILGISGGYIILILMVLFALTYMIPNIILLITFGVLFLFLGVRNKDNFGKALTNSGIFWIVFGAIAIAANSIMLLSYLPGSYIPSLIQASLILPLIASIFMVIASVFFVIYTIKVEDKILLGSSIILLVASNIFAINSLVQLIAYFL